MGTCPAGVGGGREVFVIWLPSYFAMSDQCKLGDRVLALAEDQQVHSCRWLL